MAKRKPVTVEAWLEALAELAWHDWDELRAHLRHAAKLSGLTRGSTKKNTAG